MTSPSPSPAAARIIDWFETLAPDSCATVGQIYAPDARFQDPFNDVSGLAAIEAIYRHMFVQVAGPRFRIIRHLESGPGLAASGSRDLMLIWTFHFHFRSRLMPRLSRIEQCVNGLTHLQLDDQNRICRHQDYWDTSRELYEKLPLLGSLMRWLRRHNASPASRDD